MGEIRMLNRRGDVKSVWNPRDTDEVNAARTMFDSLVKEKRFLAFRVSEAGGQGERITEFDPEAAKVIMVPPMAGGAA